MNELEVEDNMERFTIYCTQEQKMKALKLGAPLEYMRDNCGIKIYFTPTAEQMLGWLEEQGVSMQIEPINGMHYYWLLRTKELTEEPDRYSWVTQYVTPNYEEIPSRKEATLAAIDAALEYLIKIKEE